MFDKRTQVGVLGSDSFVLAYLSLVTLVLFSLFRLSVITRNFVE